MKKKKKKNIYATYENSRNQSKDISYANSAIHEGGNKEIPSAPAAVG
jgi:hypothetical protein